MKNKKVILGIGTGRCGTISLSHFYKQESSFFHPIKINWKPTDYNTPLSWELDEQAFDNA